MGVYKLNCLNLQTGRNFNTRLKKKQIRSFTTKNGFYSCEPQITKYYKITIHLIKKLNLLKSLDINRYAKIPPPPHTL